MDPDFRSLLIQRIDQAYTLIYKSLDECRQTTEDCLDEAEQEEFLPAIVQCRILLALLEVYTGNRDLALDKMARLEDELGSMASEDSQMRLAYLKGCYFFRESVYRDAFSAFVRSGTLAARIGNPLFQFFSANGKGIIKFDQAEYQDAYDYFRVARTYLQSYDSDILDILVSLNTGCAQGGLGRREEAFESLKTALKRAEEQNLIMLQCYILDEIAMALKEIGESEEARKFFRQGLEKSRSLRDEELVTELYYNYAGFLMEEGEQEKAESILSHFGSDTEDDNQLKLYHRAAAELSEKQGDYKKAAASYKEILAIHDRARDSGTVRSVYHQEKRALQEDNHRLRLVSTIGQELVATLDIGQILNLIYAQLNALMPVDFLAVGTVSGNKIDVKFSVSQGEVMEPFQLHKESPDSLLAWAVRNGTEVLMRDAEEEYGGYVRNIVTLRGLDDNHSRSVICLPLRYAGEIVGVLSVQSSRVNAYTGQDQDTLRALGSYAAIALRNALQTEKMNELNELLRQQSSMDSLTRLVNRREFVNQARNIWRICRRNKFWITLIMIDLDHFKAVNDTHGHPVGDKVLKKIGSSLNFYFKRALDCPSRYGGEELLIITGDMSPEEAAVRIELLREDFSNHVFKAPKGDFKVNFSCGIYGEVPAAAAGSRLEALTQIVDQNLYEAKSDGRNCSYLSYEGSETAQKFVPGKIGKTRKAGK